MKLLPWPRQGAPCRIFSSAFRPWFSVPVRYATGSLPSLPGLASNAQQVDAIAISGGIRKIVTQVGATFGDHFTTIADLNVLFDHLLISKGWPAMPPTLGLKGLHTSSLGCLEERNTTLRIVERHGSTILFPRICRTGALKKQKPSANALKWWVNQWENKLGLIWFNSIHLQHIQVSLLTKRTLYSESQQVPQNAVAPCSRPQKSPHWPIVAHRISGRSAGSWRVPCSGNHRLC